VGWSIYAEAKVLLKHGFAVISKKFKAVAETVAKTFEREIKAGIGKKSNKDYLSAINTYLLPFFGNYNIDRITPQVITEFQIWRTTTVGRELKASTQNNHNAALNAVFDYAVEKGYLTAAQRPKTKNTGEKTDSRGIFTTDEVVQLQAFIQEWSARTKNTRSRHLRELLGLYVAFVALTGVRPGTETKSLMWSHIEFKQLPAMRVIHITLPTGKRGGRQLVARNELWVVLDKLRQLQPEFSDVSLEDIIKKKLNLLVFRARDGSEPFHFSSIFADCLELAGISKADVEGKPRSLYSLRHYYATQRLLGGTPYPELAIQMGTSTLMLENHYRHITPLLLAEQLSGGSPLGDAAESIEIRRLMNPSLERTNMLRLITAATGISLSLTVQNAPATDELKSALATKILSKTII
jgi:integrase